MLTESRKGGTGMKTSEVGTRKVTGKDETGQERTVTGLGDSNVAGRDGTGTVQGRPGH